MRDMNFDLVEELSKKLSGIQRMKQYHKDATSHSCEDCGQLWQKLIKDDETAAQNIRDELVNHIKRNDFE